MEEEEVESAEVAELAEPAEPDGEELAELEPVAGRGAGGPAPRSARAARPDRPDVGLHGRGAAPPAALARGGGPRWPGCYRDTGDLDAAARLVSANLRLVVKLAHEYHRNPLALLDLIQEGNIGLMQAVKKFDPERGVKLSTYAAWWIRAYILRYIMDNWKMVKLGTTEAQRKLFFKLRQEQERLLQAGLRGRRPSCSPSGSTSPSRTWWRWTSGSGQDEVSLDAPVGEDGEATRGDRLLPSSGFPAADERLATEELKRLFRDKLDGLRRDARRQGEVHLREAPHRRRADDASGHRHPLRRSPRAGPADRGGAGGPDARVRALGDAGLRPRRRAEAVEGRRHPSRLRRPDLEVVEVAPSTPSRRPRSTGAPGRAADPDRRA